MHNLKSIKGTKIKHGDELMVYTEKDVIFLDERNVAFDKEFNVYEVYKTKGSHITAFGTLGSVRFITKDGIVISVMLPLVTSDEGYEWVSKETVKSYAKKYATIYNNYKKSLNKKHILTEKK
jgi:hypothetical protein